MCFRKQQMCMFIGLQNRDAGNLGTSPWASTPLSWMAPTRCPQDLSRHHPARCLRSDAGLSILGASLQGMAVASSRSGSASAALVVFVVLVVVCGEADRRTQARHKRIAAVRIACAREPYTSTSWPLKALARGQLLFCCEAGGNLSTGSQLRT